MDRAGIQGLWWRSFEVSESGIRGQVAPALRVEDWLDESFSLVDHAGQTVVLYAFQAWCQGCHTHGFPTLKALVEAFPDAAFAAVQTVFEGYEENGRERRQEMRDRYGLAIPFGQDEDRPVPAMMAAYRTGGTPWFVVVGPDGKVAADGFQVPDIVQVVRSANARRSERVGVRHEAGRYVVPLGAEQEAHVAYTQRDDVLSLVYSEVPGALRGQGLGGVMMERTLERIERDGLKVQPVCGYTVHFMRQNLRWSHLLG